MIAKHFMWHSVMSKKSNFQCRINGFPVLAFSATKSKTRFANIFSRKRWRNDGGMFRISFGKTKRGENGKARGNGSSNNKFHRGISERIAKLARTSGFARHVISFIARHVRVGPCEIFAAISGRNWYYDSPFVTLHMLCI